MSIYMYLPSEWSESKKSSARFLTLVVSTLFSMECDTCKLKIAMMQHPFLIYMEKMKVWCGLFLYVEPANN